MTHTSIPKSIAKNSLLSTALNACKTVIARELGLPKGFAISTDERVKVALQQNGQKQFPQAWLVPSDVRSVKDRQNNRAVQRYGHRMGMYGAMRNTSQVGFIFPIEVGMEIHYVDNDPLRLLRFAEACLVLSAINMLTFDIRFGSKEDPLILNTRIEVPDNASYPISDTSDTTKPGGGEVTIPIVIHTYTGFFQDVASVYAADPVIGYTVQNSQREDEFREGFKEEPLFPGLLDESPDQGED